MKPLRGSGAFSAEALSGGSSSRVPQERKLRRTKSECGTRGRAPRGVGRRARTQRKSRFRSNPGDVELCRGRGEPSNLDREVHSYWRFGRTCPISSQEAVDNEVKKRLSSGVRSRKSLHSAVNGPQSRKKERFNLERVVEMYGFEMCGFYSVKSKIDAADLFVMSLKKSRFGAGRRVEAHRRSSQLLRDLPCTVQVAVKLEIQPVYSRLSYLLLIYDYFLDRLYEFYIIHLS